MDTTNRVQIPDKAVCIYDIAITLQKSMTPIIPPSGMDKKNWLEALTLQW